MANFKRIVVLDNIGFSEKQKKQLRKIADELIVHDDNPNEQEAVKRISGSDAVISSWTTFNKNIFDNCPNLKYLGVVATGYSWIDLKTADEKGVTVTNVPGYATESVAELAIGNLIALYRKSMQADRFVRETGLFERKDFLGEELKGKTIGIIGLGRIGSRVAQLSKALGMKVMCNSRTQKECKYKFFSIDDLIPKVDIISLHASTGQELLTPERLSKLKDGAVVINFGAAESVNEEALIKELQSGRLRAVIDHFKDHKVRDEFRQLNNVVLSPEMGFYTKQALNNLNQVSVDNIISYSKNEPRNVVKG